MSYIPKNILLVRFSFETNGPSGCLEGFVPVLDRFVDLGRLRSEIFDTFIRDSFVIYGNNADGVEIKLILRPGVYNEEEFDEKFSNKS